MTTDQKPDFDILIAGGGMAGASLARALRDVPLSVGVIEATPLGPDHPSYDRRAIALAYGSKRILDAIGVWPAITAGGVSPIHHVHVSDRGHFGQTRLAAQEEGVEALGWVAEAGVIGRALFDGFERLPHATLLCPARLLGASFTPEAVTVHIDGDAGERHLTCRLLVAADGGHSLVRRQAGVATFRAGYGQTAVIADVVTDKAHGDTAFERFTDTGPLALLPNTAPHGMPGHEAGDRRWSLVWTVRDDQVEGLLGLHDAAFLEGLQARFGRRAGRFLAATPRHAYPLGIQVVRELVRERLAFVGNAAHVLHPVGGQGFNLGLRDVAALAEVLAGAVANGEDVGRLDVLRRYAAWRRPDYARTFAFTDGLARTFSTRLLPLVAARNIGLAAIDLFGPARHLLARQSMGLTGRLPRLARGLPLVEECA